jgi:hypothetical protein
MVDEKMLVAAIVLADVQKLKDRGITTLHLESASDRLQNLLRRNSDSVLAQELRLLLDQDRLFYMVGPWPPQQGGGTSSGPDRLRTCPECGKVILLTGER